MYEAHSYAHYITEIVSSDYKDAYLNDQPFTYQNLLISMEISQEILAMINILPIQENAFRSMKKSFHCYVLTEGSAKYILK